MIQNDSQEANVTSFNEGATTTCKKEDDANDGKDVLNVCNEGERVAGPIQQTFSGAQTFVWTGLQRRNTSHMHTHTHRSTQSCQNCPC